MQVERYVSRTSHTIAAQVVYFRLHRKMTQAQLAEACGVSQPDIARLERQPDHKWTMPTLLMIAGALDMEVSANVIPKD